MLDSESLIQRLIASKAAEPHQIQGCSESEIKRVCEASRLSLPESYLEFLRAIGKGAGRFMCEVDQYFDVMLNLNAEAEETLENFEEGKLSLPEKAYVFSMRFGEQFLFFIADGINDNPPIFYYYEGNGEFTDLKKSFWEVIETELIEWEDYFRNYGDDPNFF
ncbi:MAG TPA: hypothetical protein DCY03_22515 [Planctomycetaceae bacterium]|nr:hypothetical protein [Planctomycetaceae bacterium]|tara:strand:- start:2283 stop:2771 length:489 start_codon:yes stop_codon:yes gene_type:complete